MEFAELIQTPKLDGVILHSPLNEPVDGTLCITGHHLILSSRREGAQELWLLHECIDHIERRPLLVHQQPAGGTLVLRCKDLRTISLQIAGAAEFASVARSVELLSNLRDVHSLYPFFYRPMYAILEDGYTAFGVEAEFAKLLATDGSQAAAEWRLSHVNRDFSVAPTYAAVLVVPRSIDDDDLRAAAAFREGGRFPVLAYRHDNGCVLLRSSQPAAAATAPRRSRADEALLNVHLGRSKKGFIVDTWGAGRGAGRPELDMHYPQWRRITRPVTTAAATAGGGSGGGAAGMPHPGATLEALARLVEACNDTGCTTERWLGKLDASGWLSLVLNALNTACVVAQCLDQEGCPVLVNGGAAGCDTPLLVASLVQIILSPDCRTVRGLEALIEREWIQAGYPFRTRHRRSAYACTQAGGAAAERGGGGSAFVLFLDCVHQLHRQFPCSFEFAEGLLVVLFEHSFASQYGTFLGDSERERREVGLHRRTTSLWSWLNRPAVLQTWLNPCYVPNAEVIWPSVAPISLELWGDLFLRWVIDQSRAKTTIAQIQTLVTREKELRAEALRMRKELLDLAAKFDDSIQLGAAGKPATAKHGADRAAGQQGRNGSIGGKLVCTVDGGGIGGGCESVASSLGGVDSGADGGSTSSGLGGSSSTIASSSSGSGTGAVPPTMTATATTTTLQVRVVSEPNSRRSTAGEIDHPLQSHT